VADQLESPLTPHGQRPPRPLGVTLLVCGIVLTSLWSTAAQFSALDKWSALVSPLGLPPDPVAMTRQIIQGVIGLLLALSLLPPMRPPRSSQSSQASRVVGWIMLATTLGATGLYLMVNRVVPLFYLPMEVGDPDSMIRLLVLLLALQGMIVDLVPAIALFQGRPWGPVVYLSVTLVPLTQWIEALGTRPELIGIVLPLGSLYLVAVFVLRRHSIDPFFSADNDAQRFERVPAMIVGVSIGLLGSTLFRLLVAPFFFLMADLPFMARNPVAHFNLWMIVTQISAILCGMRIGLFLREKPSDWRWTPVFGVGIGLINFVLSSALLLFVFREGPVHLRLLLTNFIGTSGQLFSAISVLVWVIVTSVVRKSVGTPPNPDRPLTTKRPPPPNSHTLVISCGLVLP
jgi:hypothetical protein